MTAKKMRRWFLPATVLGLSLVASPAMAMFGNPLTPGTTSPAAGVAFPTGETLVNTQTVQLNQVGNPNVSASLTVDVYRETGGTLDFFFQVTNTGPTTLATATVSNFGFPPEFNTAGGYVSSTVPPPANMTQGTFAPISVSEVAGGSGITFNFDASTTTPGLGLGQTSSVLFVSTNATAYDTFGTSSVNGDVPVSGSNPGGNSYTGTFEPTVASAVPEPSSFVLCGLAGIIGLGVRRFRRGR